MFAVLQLGVGFEIGGRGHDVGGDAHGLQRHRECFAIPTTRCLGNHVVERGARQAAPGCRKALVHVPRVLVDDGTEREPLLVVFDGDSNPAVRAKNRVDAVGRHARVAVASALGDVAGRRVFEDGGIEGVDRGFELGEVDVLAFAGAVSMFEGGGESETGDVRREPVCIRDACADGRAIGPSGQSRDTSRRLKGETEAFESGVGAVLALHGHRHHDDVRADLAHVFIVEPHLGEEARSEALRHDVRLRDKPGSDLGSARVSQVEGHGTLVAVEVGVVGAAIETRRAGLPGATRSEGVRLVGGFHADNVCAHHREELRRPRPNSDPGKICNTEAFEDAARVKLADRRGDRAVTARTA